MKKTFFLILIPTLGLSIFYWSSCQKDGVYRPDVLDHIPGNVSFACVFDMASLLEKADFEQLRQQPLYRNFLASIKKDAPFLGTILDNPAATGIDVQKRCALFSVVAKHDPTLLLIVWTLPLKDTLAFTRTAATQLVEIQPHKGGYQIAYFQGADRQPEMPFVAWNNQVAYIGMRLQSGWPTPLEDDIRNWMYLDPQEALSAQKHARKALGASHDLTMWMSLDFASQHPSIRTTATLIDIAPQALKGNWLSGWYDFARGYSEGSLTFHLKKELSDDFVARLFKDTPEFDLSAHLPKGKVDVAISLAFDLLTTDQWLTEHPATRDFIKSILQSVHLTIEEAQGIFGGELLIAHYTEPDEGLVWGLYVQDIAALRHSLAAAEAHYLIKARSDNIWEIDLIDVGDVFFRTGKPIALLIIQHEILWLIPQGPLAQVLTKSQPVVLPRPFRNALKNHPFGLVLDIASLKRSSHLLPMEWCTLYTEENALYNHIRYKEDKKNSLRQLLDWLQAKYNE